MSKQYLINTEESSNKFWIGEYIQGNGFYTVYWGRLGTNGQSKDFPCNQYSGERLLRNKITEKQRKGYFKVSQAEFDLETAKATIIGSSNICHTAQWIKIENWRHDDTELKLVQVSDRELADPGYVPHLYTHVTTRKEYETAFGKMSDFHFIFTNSASFMLDPRGKLFKLDLDSMDRDLRALVEKAQSVISVMFA